MPTHGWHAWCGPGLSSMPRRTPVSWWCSRTRPGTRTSMCAQVPTALTSESSRVTETRCSRGRVSTATRVCCCWMEGAESRALRGWERSTAFHSIEACTFLPQMSRSFAARGCPPSSGVFRWLPPMAVLTLRLARTCRSWARCDATGNLSLCAGGPSIVRVSHARALPWPTARRTRPWPRSWVASSCGDVGWTPPCGPPLRRRGGCLRGVFPRFWRRLWIPRASMASCGTLRRTCVPSTCKKTVSMSM